MVNQEFKKMALSFYGCDGGNLESPVWTCGLEWGGGYGNFSELENELEPSLLNKAEGFYNSDVAWDLNGEDVLSCLRHQYNQKLAWLFAYLYDWNIEKFKDEAVKNNLFCSAGLGFKMNAFPLSFKNRNSVIWDEQVINLIGLDSFNDYREWCIKERGRFFNNLVNQYSPKVIICTGITSADEFFRFFRCDIDTCQVTESVHVAATNQGSTLVFVVPFFCGANGINSYEKMASITESIKNIATKHFNSDSWHQNIT